MVMGFYSGMDLAEFYRVLFVNLICLLGILILIFFLSRKKIFHRIFTKLSHITKEHNKSLTFILLFFILLVIVSICFVTYVAFKLDKDTKVVVEEKIVIIEIDDYWNLNDTAEFFEPYGYTLERFRQVSGILNKYRFTASLGITPYIFVEEIRENFALEDDEEMVDYLLELDEKGYELAMHGYNHCRNLNYCPKYEEIWYNIFIGKEGLEKLLGRRFVTYFPPGNYWTDEQYDNVKRAGFKIIGNTHVSRAYFDRDVIITPKGYDPVYYYGYYQKDFRHTPVEEWIEAYEGSNLFILQLHCNTFDSSEKLDDLDKFLSRIKEDGTKVMTYKEFYDYIMKKRDKEGITYTGKIIIE